jgi:membrane protein insertase Oxa1/YidC/SpoIIIJ
MLSCRRLIFSYSHFSYNPIASLLITRHSSSSSPSTDLSTILQEQSISFEKKPSSTIAFETFVQTPAEFVANSLVNIHDSLALPWWATIALATVTFRIIIGASITIAQQRFIERLQKVRRNVSSELEPRIRTLNIQAMKGKTATVLEEKKHIKREVKDLRRNEIVF